MFLGSRVDDALSDYHRHVLAHRERLPLEEVLERYRAGWTERLEAEQDDRGVVFDEFDEPTMLTLGVDALKATFEQLVPQLGTPVAVQRRIEFTLAPGLEWSIVGYLDLETEWPDLAGEGVISEVVDYKVKGGTRSTRPPPTATRRPSLYLAGRWLEGQPADRFAFAQTLQARQEAQAHLDLADPDRTDDRTAARDARADRARRQRDRRLRRAVRARPAVGARRSHELEVLGALLLALAQLPGRRRPVARLRTAGPVPTIGPHAQPRTRQTTRRSHHAQPVPRPLPRRRCATPERARSRPGCSAASPTTNAPTAASPATAPPDAAAGRRRRPRNRAPPPHRHDARRPERRAA